MSLENDTNYHFLIIENALREMKFDCSILPHRLEKNLKLIRDELSWIERHHLPSGLPKSILSKILEKTIYLSPEKGKNAIAFQIHGVLRRPYVYELVGIKIVFGTSENGNPGLWIEGTRKDPVIVKVTDLPWITEDALKTHKKFAKWINDHLIDPKKLSEKVEEFAVVDIGLVEMSELGLGELEHQAMDQEEVEKEKIKAKQKSSPTPVRPIPIRGTEDSDSKSQAKKIYPPIYRQKTFDFMKGISGSDQGYVPEWGPIEE